MKRITLLITLIATTAFAQGQAGMDIQDSRTLFLQGMERSEAVEVADGLYQAVGFGNTFMVTTDEGNVIIDTGLNFVAPHAKKILTAVDDGPVKYIVLTHAHPDHRMGVPIWKEEDTEVIAQKEYIEMRHYQERLRGIFALRNAAQYSGIVPPLKEGPPGAGNYGADIEATRTFDDEYTFAVGDTEFKCIHTPGETYGQLSVWIPKYKAAFVGDNFYDSFPNIYTLRGTKPRWALDYVESLNTILELEPEILLPSHGLPIKGKDEIRDRVTRYRDAILHVHDETVKGMNKGKDVYTLMREITLPPELEVPEGYGKVSWSVRGIYEGYMGWFDGNPATMYSTPASAVYPDIVEMAGGAEAVAKKADALREEGKLVEALHMADMALAAAPENTAALQAKLAALQALEADTTNTNERGWLVDSIKDTERALNAE